MAKKGRGRTPSCVNVTRILKSNIQLFKHPYMSERLLRRKFNSSPNTEQELSFAKRLCKEQPTAYKLQRGQPQGSAILSAHCIQKENGKLRFITDDISKNIIPHLTDQSQALSTSMNIHKLILNFMFLPDRFNILQIDLVNGYSRIQLVRQRIPIVLGLTTGSESIFVEVTHPIQGNGPSANIACYKFVRLFSELGNWLANEYKDTNLVIGSYSDNCWIAYDNDEINPIDIHGKMAKQIDFIHPYEENIMSLGMVRNKTEKLWKRKSDSAKADSYYRPLPPLPFNVKEYPVVYCDYSSKDQKLSMIITSSCRLLGYIVKDVTLEQTQGESLALHTSAVYARALGIITIYSDSKIAITRLERRSNKSMAYFPVDLSVYSGLRISYIPTKCNPADPLSRIPELPQALSETVSLLKENYLSYPPIGEIGYRNVNLVNDHASVKEVGLIQWIL